MPHLNPAARRVLKAKSHALRPVVMIGADGLTPAVLAEIDRALNAHELIKIRASGDDRTVRASWLDQICTHTGASPVHCIGKMLVIHRENPAPAAPQSPAGSTPRRTRPPRTPSKGGLRLKPQRQAVVRPRANAGADWSRNVEPRQRPTTRGKPRAAAGRTGRATRSSRRQST